MPTSTLTVKYQATIPKEVPEKLGGEEVRITAAATAFLGLQERFKVGPGDPVEDVRRARELMGRTGR